MGKKLIINVFLVAVLVFFAGQVTPFKDQSEEGRKASAKIISRNPNDVLFALFNDKTDKSRYEVLQYGNLTNITASSLDTSRETKFLVHGFLNNRTTWFPRRTKDVYLGTSLEYNIIVVDWGKLATPAIPILYPLATENVRRVGIRLGKFISLLRNNSLIDLAKIQIIGFSLGAHIAGVAGSNVKTEFKEPIARITALDAAGPKVYSGTLARNLRPGDAAFVDAYHTNAGQIGIWEAVGHTDIYLNGGTGPQPGCPPALNVCSHSWVSRFYTNTIGNGTLRPEDQNICACNDVIGYTSRSCSCDKRITVGEYLQPGATGESFVDYRFRLEDWQ